MRRGCYFVRYVSYVSLVSISLLIYSSLLYYRVRGVLSGRSLFENLSHDKL